MNAEGHLTAKETESQSNAGPSNKQTNKQEPGRTAAGG